MSVLVSDWVIDWFNDRVIDLLSGVRVFMRERLLVSELVRECAWVRELVSELASESMSECVSEWVSVWVSKLVCGT